MIDLGSSLLYGDYFFFVVCYNRTKEGDFVLKTDLPRLSESADDNIKAIYDYLYKLQSELDHYFSVLMRNNSQSEEGNTAFVSKAKLKGDSA